MSKKNKLFYMKNFCPILPKSDLAYYKKTNDYFIYAPFGKDCPCDMIGVDIGTVHLAFVGLKYQDNSNKNFPCVISWICLISIRTSSITQTSDKLINILLNNVDFEWLRKCTYFRIEEQVQWNKKAQKIAAVLRTCFRCMLILLRNDTKPDVEFVHGECKYLIAPYYNLRASSIHEEAKGIKNKSIRKKICVDDFIALMNLNQENEILTLVSYLFKPKNTRLKKNDNGTIQYLDKLDDIADAYLIIRYAVDPLILKSKRKRKQINNNDNNNDNNNNNNDIKNNKRINFLDI